MRPIDDIKDRLDLVEFVRQDQELQREGNHFKGCCPFHSEKTASFHVWMDHFYCFACGARGDVFEYVGKTQNLSFAESLRQLARLTGVTLHEDPEEQKRREEHLSRTAILRKVAEFYHSLLTDEVCAYLRGRGFTDEFIDSYRIGWAPGDALGKSDIGTSDLKSVGLLNKANLDYFRQRIIFPVWGRYEDEIVDLAGRVLGQEEPKFLKLPGESTLINERGMRGQKVVFLVEGDTDTASAVQLGLPVVGVRGVYGLKDEFAAKFAKVETIYVCADNDEPKVNKAGKLEDPVGLKLIQRAGEMFGNRARILTIPKVTLPDGSLGKDVNDYALKARCDLKELANFAPTYLDWLIAQVPIPVPPDRVESLVHSFTPPLKKLSSAGQDAYTKTIAKKLGISLSSIRGELRAAIAASGNGHGKPEIDSTQIIWSDINRMNPSQSLIEGVMYTTVFLDKIDGEDENGVPKVVTLPHLVNSRRELFELNDGEMYRRGLFYAKSKVPSYTVLGQRWHINPSVSFSLKNYLDGGATVDPWEVYSEVSSYFRRFLWYPNPLYHDFLALWTCATYFYRLFQAFPYVHLLGTKRCGKTLTLDIINTLAFNSFLASSISSAALYRTIEMCSATVLFDEAENLQTKKKNDEGDDKLEILKDGYKQAAQVLRCTGDDHTPSGFDSYCPKVFGGTQSIEKTLGDRIIQLTLSRKHKSIKIEEFNSQQHMPLLHHTRDKLYILMLDQGNEIAERITDGLGWDQIHDRDRELWLPIMILAAFFDDYYLAQVADESSVNVDDLLVSKMRRLAVEVTQQRQASDRLDQLEIIILEAILEFTESHAAVMDNWYNSGNLLKFLRARDELWDDLTIQRVYNELEKMNIIKKSEDVERQKPVGGGERQRCVRLNKDKLLDAATRLGLKIPGKVE